MSKIEEHIQIVPPSGMHWPSSRTEILKSKIYECNVCNGSGGEYVDSNSIYFDPKKGAHYKACKMCKGTGEIQCNIITEWVSVGKVKDEFKNNEDEKNSI